MGDEINGVADIGEYWKINETERGLAAFAKQMTQTIVRGVVTMNDGIKERKMNLKWLNAVAFYAWIFSVALGCVPTNDDAEDTETSTDSDVADSDTSQHTDDTADTETAAGTDLILNDKIYGDVDAYVNRHSEVADTFFGHIYLEVEHTTYSDHELFATDLNARFYEILVPEESENIGEIIKEMRGFNDCSMFIWGGNGYTDMGQRIDLDAGDAVLAYDDIEIPVTVTDSGITIYTTHFSEQNVLPVFGGTYQFRTTGNQTPPIEMDVTLPADIRATLSNHPDLNVAPDGDLEVLWTNPTHDGLVSINYTGLNWALSEGGAGASSNGPYYNITCLVDDDGGFVMPGGLFAQITDAHSGMLTVRRELASYDEMEVGKWVRLNGSVAHTVYLAYPQE